MDTTLPSHPNPNKTSTSPPTQHPTNTDFPACRNAIKHTSSWKPSCLDRRQSWSSQDQRHEFHMNGLEGVQSGHQGFTEKS